MIRLLEGGKHDSQAAPSQEDNFALAQVVKVCC